MVKENLVIGISGTRTIGEVTINLTVCLMTHHTDCAHHPVIGTHG
jgi:hypothetical protein